MPMASAASAAVLTPFLMAMAAPTVYAQPAFSKAMGTGFRGSVNFGDISVLNNELGAPYLKFGGALAEEIESRAMRFHISLSDCETTAIAVVICERKD